MSPMPPIGGIGAWETLRAATRAYYTLLDQGANQAEMDDALPALIAARQQYRAKVFEVAALINADPNQSIASVSAAHGVIKVDVLRAARGIWIDPPQP